MEVDRMETSSADMAEVVRYLRREKDRLDAELSLVSLPECMCRNRGQQGGDSLPRLREEELV